VVARKFSWLAHRLHVVASDNFGAIGLRQRRLAGGLNSVRHYTEFKRGIHAHGRGHGQVDNLANDFLKSRRRHFNFVLARREIWDGVSSGTGGGGSPRNTGIDLCYVD
jgi:hypothetical protein